MSKILTFEVGPTPGFLGRFAKQIAGLLVLAMSNFVIAIGLPAFLLFLASSFDLDAVVAVGAKVLGRLAGLEHSAGSVWLWLIVWFVVVSVFRFRLAVSIFSSGNSAADRR